MIANFMFFCASGLLWLAIGMFLYLFGKCISELLEEKIKDVCDKRYASEFLVRAHGADIKGILERLLALEKQ